MQLYLYSIGISIPIILSMVWFFFHTIDSSRKKRVFLAKDSAAKKNLIKSPNVIKKKEKYYQLNTHAIKLNLYSKSHFNNYIVERIYQNIIIANYWLNEPFHTEFVRLLQFVGNNKLWIKDPKTREIIINTRDNTEKLNTQISMNVLSLSEVLESVIFEVYAYLKHKKVFLKSDVQNSILSASIYVLIEAGEIDSVCQKLGIFPSDKKSLRSALIDIIYVNLSNKRKTIIDENYCIVPVPMTKIYAEVLFISNQYPYTFSRENPSKPNIKLLPYVPEKQLRSIV